MEQDPQEALRAIGEEADDLADKVEQALEEHATQVFMRETRARVDDLGRRFRALLSSLDEKQRFQAERNVGRKVTAIQQSATKLPAAPVGAPAEKRIDTGFFETRAPTSSRPPVAPGHGARRGPRKLGVADEIESWCGKCGEMRTSTIAAMVDGAPAQVVCTVCGSKYKYRPEPPPKKGATTTRATAAATTTKAEDPKAKERRELQNALANAENVRAFSAHERYKAGEIIQHPEHGRGRIESVLPRSLLVRFVVGLKPVKIG